MDLSGSAYETVAGLAIVCLATVTMAGDPAERETYVGAIDVTRVVTEARVVSGSGQAVLGLGPDDFSVFIDDTPTSVESVTWVDGSAVSADVVEWIPRPADKEGPDPLQPGRLVVVLVQTDFHKSRLGGMVRTSRYARELLQGFGPQDRVAVAVFGSHLELHRDFTSDTDVILEELKPQRILQTGVHDEGSDFPSLGATFDQEEALRAAKISAALEVLGRALEPLPGPKSIVLIGWGLGRFTSGGVQLGRSYTEAFEWLARSRTSVFSLDVTEADFHSLEVGLRAVSSDTGGTYAKTWHFPGAAVNRLSRLLSGHYELSVIVPPGIECEACEIDLRVDRPGSLIVTRPYVLIGGELNATP